jgi:tetratricopeptide (TPR) repeat protein
MGKYREAVEVAQRAFAIPGHTREPEVFFLARLVWFLGLVRLGRLDESMPLALETLEMARSIGDRKQLGRVLAQVGFAAFEQSEPAAAGQYLYEALQIATELNDRKLQTRVFLNLAMFETGVNGDLGKAAEYYHKTVQVAHEIGDRSSESKAFGNLGFVAGLRGDFQEAISYLEKALTAAREMGENYHQILLFVNLSANAGIQNQPTLAAEYARQAIELAKLVGERSGEAWGWMYLGYAQLALDQIEHARTSFELSLQIREEMGQAALSMEPLAGLVEVGLRAENMDLAAQITEKILAHLQNGGTLNGTDEPLRVYYNCYRLLEKKQDPRARQVLHDALHMLDAQLAKLSDARARQMYVENVPWRLALRNASSDVI